MEEYKPWVGLTIKQDFAEGRKLKPKDKKEKRLNWET